MSVFWSVILSICRSVSQSFFASHLDGKLSGWQEDEDSCDVRVSWTKQETLKDWKHEGGCLPCVEGEKGGIITAAIH